MLDVPADEVRKVDPAGMMQAVLEMPRLFERALASIQAAPPFTLPRQPRNILMTGLGGSAIGGDLLAHLAERVGKVPIVVNRTYDIPAWVGPDTLVVAASYSGGTEETLSAFIQAKRKGAMLAATSAGGKLAEFAKKAGAAYLPMEAGFQPRAAVPLSVVPQMAFLVKAGVFADLSSLDETVRALKSLVADLSPDASPSRNEAKRIALAVKDTVPFVYGSEHMAPVARRWANQFNENSKVLAAWGIMPEMNHNELVGWTGDDDLDKATAIFLRHSGEHPQVRERFDFTAKVLVERGGRVVQVESRARDALPAMFTSMFIGDAASVYLAALRGVDPSPVPIITQLKERVGGTGFAAKLGSEL